MAILQKKNSSIANFMENSDHNSFNNSSLDPLKRPEASRVRFDMDGLFSSYDTINDKMSFKQVPKSSLSHKSEAKYSISNYSKHSYK